MPFITAAAVDNVESETIAAAAQLANAAYTPSGGTNKATVSCGAGTATRLECLQERANIPQHDVDLGRTELVLRTNDGAELRRQKLTELWEGMGFNRETGCYVIGSKNESGIRVSLRGLVLLDEKSAKFRDTAFGREDWKALSALMSPDARYLAFIAQKEEDPQARLYVYDVVRNRVSRLGDAPAPPPLATNPDPQKADWPWDSLERHYTDLESAIWKFTTPHTLEVSYGADTWDKRAQKRTSRSYELEHLK